jgi:hypothetical protein
MRTTREVSSITIVDWAHGVRKRDVTHATWFSAIRTAGVVWGDCVAIDNHGRIIAEATVEPGYNGDVIVMMPDGSVEVLSSTSEAGDAARTWIKRTMDKQAVNVATIEWRGGSVPA